MELSNILSELDINKVTQHIKWFTEETPARISGSGQDRKAAEYIVNTLRSYGLEAGIYEFEAYNSRPGSGSLQITSPIREVVPCQPCAHVLSTPPAGVEAELVYVRAGGQEDYEGIDVKGKIVLAEVSYAPATPEKARIAWSKGAIGIVLANWGTPEEDVICMRALKAVWGNPTTKTFNEIPQIAGVTISRPWGEKLAGLCQKGTVRVKPCVTSPRFWEKLPQPYGILRGSVEPEKFVLVTGHLDAWEPGVTCNATGDATILEITRVLAKHASELRRSVYFVFWNGHEIAEAAGSTWFVDSFWPDISENCVAYINIDSTGMRGTSFLKVSVSRELSEMVQKLSKDVLDEPIHISHLTRTGDQSFFGVGVPAISGRYSFSDEYIAKTHGATLGWWNHTRADTFDKYDPEVMTKDIKVQASYVWTLATSPLVPYGFDPLIKDISDKIDKLMAESGNVVDLAPIKDEIARLKTLIQQVSQLAGKGNLAAREVAVLNRVYLKLCRLLTNAFYTYTDRFDQDSYGLSILSKPIPVLYRMVDLVKMDPASLDFKLLRTELIRARNRVWDAVNGATYALKDALSVLHGADGFRN